MKEVSIIGLDLAKRIFQIEGRDSSGRSVMKRQLRRSGLLKFFSSIDPCTIGMETSGSAHYWARELMKLGHKVRLIPAVYVKPFVKPGRKNDATDAAAICEAMQRADLRSVPVKTEEQQAICTLHKTRKLLITQRVMLSNALRSHFSEFGIIAPQGDAGFQGLIAAAMNAENNLLPTIAREALAVLAEQWRCLSAQIKELDAKILAHHRMNEESRRLATIPGIGPLTASALVAAIGDPRRFKSARHFSAWLGLVPRQHSSGGKTRLGRITKMGDGYLRSLLVIGATSMLRARAGFRSEWFARLRERKSARQATIALANKMARIAWALLMQGEVYRDRADTTAA